MVYLVGAVFLMCVVALMGAGALFFNRKPVQHCGGSSLKYKGERIDCPVCAGCEKNCDKSPVYQP